MDARVAIEASVHCCETGYCWVDADVTPYGTNRLIGEGDMRSERCRFLVDEPFFSGVNFESSFLHPSTRPLDDRDTALFRRFTRLDATEQQIVDFASTHGRLSSVHWLGIFTSPDGRHTSGTGDRLADWQFQILWLRHWVTIWDLADKPKQLGEYLDALPRGRDPEVPEQFVQPYWSRADSRDLARSVAGDKISDRDLARNAKRHVCLAISEQLRDAPDLTEVKLELRYSDEAGSGAFRVASLELQTALWLQFATAVTENKQFRSCPQCGTPFEVTPELNRTSRVFCKETCKLKAFRLRKREALRLHQKERTLKQIADVLETEVSKVRGWIKNKGR